jgi:hypothetical protein
VNINEISYFTGFNHFSLGSTEAARMKVTDFGIFLHRNPGACRVWEVREIRLAKGREVVETKLTEGMIISKSPYVESVIQVLERLDQTVE